MARTASTTSPSTAIPNTLNSDAADAALHEGVEEHARQLHREQDRRGLPFGELQHGRNLATAPVGIGEHELGEHAVVI